MTPAGCLIFLRFVGETVVVRTGWHILCVPHRPPVRQHVPLV